MPLPTATFDKLKTLVGRQSIISITPAGGEAKLYLVEYVGDRGTIDIGRIMGPGANNGPAHTASTWTRSRAEMWAFRTKELKRVITDFGSLTFHLDGAVATMYIRDPRDASAKVGLQSEVGFSCAVYRDPTEVAHSPAAEGEVTIIIESLKDGAVTMTPDADIPA